MALAYMTALGTNKKIDRKFLRHYVELHSGDTELIGIGTEDSVLEYDFDETSTTDIYGNIENTINSVNRTQTFDKSMRSGNKLDLEMLEIDASNDWTNSKWTVYLVYAMIVDGTDKYLCMKYENSTIRPDSVGGASSVDMPITIIYGTPTRGTVTDYNDPSTFSETAATFNFNNSLKKTK